MKLGSYVTKNSAVPTINLNDLSGRTSVAEVPVSDTSKPASDSLNWSNLVRKDPYTGACMINLGNLATASGKKIIITTTSNQVTGGVNPSPSIGAQVMSSGGRINPAVCSTFGGITMTPSSPALPRSDILSSQGGMGNIRVNSLTPGAVNTAQSPSVSLLHGNPTLQHSMSTPALPDLEHPHSVNGLNGSIPASFKANVTHKDLSRLWSNEDVKLKKVGPSVQQVKAHVQLSVFYCVNLKFKFSRGVFTPLTPF